MIAQNIDNIIYCLQQLKQELQGLESHIDGLEAQVNYEINEIKKELIKNKTNNI